MKNRLKEMRELKGLSQEKLAQVADVSRTTISEIETEKKVVVTNITLEKISKALDLKVTDIFFRD